MNLSNIIFNRIVMMNICLLLIGIILCFYTKNILFLFLVFYVFIINEFFHYFFGTDIYFCGDRTELMYSTGSLEELISTDLKNVKPNLTEGYFPDKKKISTEESEINRFNEFIRLLDIQPGDTVLDAGCGHGGLVMYLRSKNIYAYGITITKTQFIENNEIHGPYFYYGDYTEHQSQLVNKFDHIILPGSLEHPFGGNQRLESAYEYKFNGMKDMFSNMKTYFRENSSKKKILCTCLHLNMKYKDSNEMFAMERLAGCLYPPVDHLNVAEALQGAGYKVLINEDYTWHYYFATVCDPQHFGTPMDIGTLLYLTSIWFFPHIIYCKFIGNYGLWMWMFDGKYHYPDNYQYSYVEDINERPCTLFYTVGKLT